jgi:tetratricopeptide (TPR) repeat protein
MSKPPGERGAQQPPDEGLLAAIRSAFETADPVPAGLVERIRFAVALADENGIASELAAYAGTEQGQAGEGALAALARGAAEESRTITFDSSELTIMIRVDANPEGTARVDGWLAPPHRCQVEIALIGGSLTAHADADGRFAFPSVPRGTVRLVVRPPGQAAAGSGEGGAQAGAAQGGPALTKTVTTPVLVLLPPVNTAERRARDAQRQGQRAGNAGQPAVGARLVREGLAVLGWREDGGGPSVHSALAARLIITLAYLEAEQGRADYGLRLLDQAEQAVPAAERGVVHAQRGVMLLRTGRWEAALGQLTAAERLVGDPEDLAGALLNRSVLHLNTLNVPEARNDLRRCAAIAAEAGLGLLAAKATQNLGYCDLLSGDIPAALAHLDAAARDYQATAPGLLPALETDRARVLLAAGLAADAAAALDASIAAFRRQHRDQLLAEAELARAQAAQAGGDLAAARHWAGLAVRRFRARGNDAWAELAELTRLRAASDAARQAGRGHRLIATRARQVAGRLRAHGLPGDAALAELLAARALAAARRREEAVKCLAAAGGRGLPLEAVLLRRLARAELAAVDGRPGTALAELRAGLATVHALRGQLGSLDLQTGTAARGAELAGLGLRLVLARGSPRQVFSWLERSRAQSFRLRPVRPPADQEAAAVLTELRQLGFLARSAELGGGQPDPAHAARRAELQRQVRQRAWRLSGPGEATAVADAAEVIAALADSGQVLASIAVHDGRLLAVTIVAGRLRLTQLGDFAAAAEASRRLSADLDALTGRRLPPRLAAVIRESASRQTAVLDAQVLEPLSPLLGRAAAGASLVIVPAGELSAVPWGMLPSLRGRPVTVCPSASAWLASWRAAAGPAPAPAGAARPAVPGAAPAPATGPAQDDGGLPLLVAGPGLPHAVPEVSQIAAVYPGSRPLTGAAATVEATLRALDGAPLAHLAAHGHHDRGNVLFSRLDLADGPLMAYDIQQLAVPPRQVVLSACDVGRTVVRPGDEILGFTAALLRTGTPTVISSVTRVADDVAFEIMTAYHRSFAQGARPALALALAQAPAPGAAPFTTPGELAAAPFVCFGAG